MTVSSLLLAAIVLLVFGPMAATSKNYPIAKPNCVDRCGNLSVPFPFGLTKGCYLDPGFFINCNTSTNPPTPLLGHGNLEVRKISVNGQISVMNYVSKLCREDNKTSRWANIRLTPNIYVNQTANMFVAVGCNINANVLGGYGSRPYRSCTTHCKTTDKHVDVDFRNGKCSGVGCCQMNDIPGGLAMLVNVTLERAAPESGDGYLSNCSYAMVVEKEFKFPSDMLAKRWQVRKVPLLLDWVILDGNCSNACNGKNSQCAPFTTGPYGGNRCQCKQGYRGNPYLPPGCQDIDECGDGLNNCSKNAFCINTKGGYDCTCKKGYHGNGMGESGCILSDECKDNGKGCKTNRREMILIFTIALGTILLLIGCFCLYLGFRQRKSFERKQKFFKENGGLILQQRIARQGSDSMGNTPRIFTSHELEKATNHYDQTRVIGQGGSGIVYKGIFLDGGMVAVKKAKMIDPTQVEQFINEVIVLSQINHKNIVKLYGCCLETEVPLLVYEFIANGTLSEHLHNQHETSTLPWSTRLRIATEAADVLSYLHSAASPPIIHRDVKSVNILLDDEYTAKVSDFGASRLVPQDQTQITTMVQGTFGYLDPEYMQTHHLTEKSDVYSFGVVLVELLTSRRAVSFNCPEEERNLSLHFLSLLKENQLFKILDDNIVCVENKEELREVALLAKMCLNVKGEDRPTMKEVAVKLDGLKRASKQPRVHDAEFSTKSEAFLTVQPTSFDYDIFSIIMENMVIEDECDEQQNMEHEFKRITNY